MTPFLKSLLLGTTPVILIAATLDRPAATSGDGIADKAPTSRPATQPADPPPDMNFDVSGIRR